MREGAIRNEHGLKRSLSVTLALRVRRRRRGVAQGCRSRVDPRAENRALPWAKMRQCPVLEENFRRPPEFSIRSRKGHRKLRAYMQGKNVIIRSFRGDAVILFPDDAPECVSTSALSHVTQSRRQHRCDIALESQRQAFGALKVPQHESQGKEVDEEFRTRSICTRLSAWLSNASVGVLC